MTRGARDGVHRLCICRKEEAGPSPCTASAASVSELLSPFFTFSTSRQVPTALSQLRLVRYRVVRSRQNHKQPRRCARTFGTRKSTMKQAGITRLLMHADACPSVSQRRWLAHGRPLFQPCLHRVKDGSHFIILDIPHIRPCAQASPQGNIGKSSGSCARDPE